MIFDESLTYAYASGPLLDGKTFVLIDSYEYYANGSYSIYFSNDMAEYYPLQIVNQTAFSMFVWTPAYSNDTTLRGNFWSPNY